jgi:predicted branched-subunit amino acid permease
VDDVAVDDLAAGIPEDTAACEPTAAAEILSQPMSLPAPEWARAATKGEAFRRGLLIAGQVPAMILAATGAGFGALAHDAGLSLGHSAFMSLVLYATPAQVVLVDQFARGASLLAGAFAICLTAIRLLPMMVSLMPYLRAPGVPRWQYLLASHYIAITGWTEAFRRLPALPERLRLPHFLGLGTALMLMLTLGTLVGYELAGSVPPLFTSALLFMTPLYFTMSLLLNTRDVTDGAALAAGVVLGPIFFLAVPGFDLLLTGLVGGTLAFLVGRRARGVVP